MPLCDPARESPLRGGDSLLGESRAVCDIKSQLQKIAKTDSNVLITGETGTGKEVVAQLIHKNSSRTGKPIICINCAAIPDTLLESELFGYERGAFTGAHTSQQGKLKLADGGTVFFDEIGDLSLFNQAKVLRVIESREIQRLGSAKPLPIDFRLITATNCEPESLVAEGKFRKDLFFRLNVARINLPPLRERREDILILANFFRETFNLTFGMQTAGFTPIAQAMLLSHAWPGNIRELRNVVEAAFVNLEPGVKAVNLPVPFCQALTDCRKLQGSGLSELDRILTALSETHWNKSNAAAKMHWSRMTLYRKMSRYHIPEGSPDK